MRDIHEPFWKLHNPDSNFKKSKPSQLEGYVTTVSSNDILTPKVLPMEKMYCNVVNGNQCSGLVCEWIEI